MTNPAFVPPPDAWFCIQAQPRRDHIAAVHLRQIDGLRVFAPQIQYQKLRKGVKVRRTEPLFPGYLFAQFDFAPLYRLVQLTPGVARLVEFGGRYATLEEGTMRELRQLTDATGIREVTPPGPEAGESVTVGAGPFRGSTGIVLDWKPAQERVRVLLELMGREVPIEVALEDLTRDREIRAAVLSLAAG